MTLADSALELFSLLVQPTPPSLNGEGANSGGSSTWAAVEASCVSLQATLGRMVNEGDDAPNALVTDVRLLLWEARCHTATQTLSRAMQQLCHCTIGGAASSDLARDVQSLERCLSSLAESVRSGTKALDGFAADDLQPPSSLHKLTSLASSLHACAAKATSYLHTCTQPSSAAAGSNWWQLDPPLLELQRPDGVLMSPAGGTNNTSALLSPGRLNASFSSSSFASASGVLLSPGRSAVVATVKPLTPPTEGDLAAAAAWQAAATFVRRLAAAMHASRASLVLLPLLTSLLAVPCDDERASANHGSVLIGRLGEATVNAHALVQLRSITSVLVASLEHAGESLNDEDQQLSHSSAGVDSLFQSVAGALDALTRKDWPAVTSLTDRAVVALSDATAASPQLHALFSSVAALLSGLRAEAADASAITAVKKALAASALYDGDGARVSDEEAVRDGLQRLCTLLQPYEAATSKPISARLAALVTHAACVATARQAALDEDLQALLQALGRATAADSGGRDDVSAYQQAEMMHLFSEAEALAAVQGLEEAISQGQPLPVHQSSADVDEAGLRLDLTSLRWTHLEAASEQVKAAGAIGHPVTSVRAGELVSAAIALRRLRPALLAFDGLLQAETLSTDAQVLAAAAAGHLSTALAAASKELLLALDQLSSSTSIASLLSSSEKPLTVQAAAELACRAVVHTTTAAASSEAALVRDHLISTLLSHRLRACLATCAPAMAGVRPLCGLDASALNPLPLQAALADCYALLFLAPQRRKGAAASVEALLPSLLTILRSCLAVWYVRHSLASGSAGTGNSDVSAVAGALAFDGEQDTLQRVLAAAEGQLLRASRLNGVPSPSPIVTSATSTCPFASAARAEISLVHSCMSASQQLMAAVLDAQAGLSGSSMRSRSGGTNSNSNSSDDDAVVESLERAVTSATDLGVFEPHVARPAGLDAGVVQLFQSAQSKLVQLKQAQASLQDAISTKRMADLLAAIDAADRAGLPDASPLMQEAMTLYRDLVALQGSLRAALAACDADAVTSALTQCRAIGAPWPVASDGNGEEEESMIKQLLALPRGQQLQRQCGAALQAGDYAAAARCTVQLREGEMTSSMGSDWSAGVALARAGLLSPQASDTVAAAGGRPLALPFNAPFTHAIASSSVAAAGEALRLSRLLQAFFAAAAAAAAAASSSGNQSDLPRAIAQQIVAAAAASDGASTEHLADELFAQLMLVTRDDVIEHSVPLCELLMRLFMVGVVPSEPMEACVEAWLWRMARQQQRQQQPARVHEDGAGVVLLEAFYAAIYRDAAREDA